MILRKISQVVEDMDSVITTVLRWEAVFSEPEVEVISDILRPFADENKDDTDDGKKLAQDFLMQVAEIKNEEDEMSN